MIRQRHGDEPEKYVIAKATFAQIAEESKKRQIAKEALYKRERIPIIIKQIEDNFFRKCTEIESSPNIHPGFSIIFQPSTAKHGESVLQPSDRNYMDEINKWAVEHGFTTKLHQLHLMFSDSDHPTGPWAVDFE